MEKLRKLMEKKRAQGKMSDHEKNAKIGVLQNIRDLAHSAMSDKMKGLKKVSVAAPDKQGLSNGLEMAKHLVENQSGMHPSEEDDQNEGAEGYADGGRVGDTVGSSTADELENEEDDGMISRHGGGSKIVDAEDEGENDDRDEDEAQEEDHESSEDDLEKQIMEATEKLRSLNAKRK